MTVVINYVVMLFLSYLKGTQGSCANLSSIDQSKVANMCQNSATQGTDVYIETSATTTLAHGVACTCQVDVQNGKQVDAIFFYGQQQITNCGTMLKFSHNVNAFDVSCGNYSHNFTTSQHTNIAVDLIKSIVDGIVSYCTHFSLHYCQANQFQCDDLTCINSTLRCDNLGDCNDDTDEANCDPDSCNENFVKCGDTCISPTEPCNDTVNGNGTTGTPLSPLITITCEESPYLSHVTTTKPKGVDDDDDDDDNKVIIIAGVIGGLFLLVLIIVAVVYIIHTAHRREQVNAEQRQ